MIIVRSQWGRYNWPRYHIISTMLLILDHPPKDSKIFQGPALSWGVGRCWKMSLQAARISRIPDLYTLKGLWEICIKLYKSATCGGWEQQLIIRLCTPTVCACKLMPSLDSSEGLQRSCESQTSCCTVESGRRPDVRASAASNFHTVLPFPCYQDFWRTPKKNNFRTF